MAGAAMRETLGEISAAVPLLALRRVLLIRALPQEQKLPAGEQHAYVQRKGNLVRRRRRAHGFARHEKRVERARVVAREQSEVIIGKGGIKMPACAVHALGERAAESFLRPLADAGHWIGGDVRRIDRSERGRQRASADKGASAGRGVTGDAVAGGGELRTALHKRGIEAARAEWRDGIDRSAPGEGDESQRRGKAKTDNGQERLEGCHEARPDGWDTARINLLLARRFPRGSTSIRRSLMPVRTVAKRDSCSIDQSSRSSSCRTSSVAAIKPVISMKAQATLSRPLVLVSCDRAVR